MDEPYDVDEFYDEEEQDLTRCVCGNAGDDKESPGEFLVQCERCNVWQHGQCMGIRSEDLVREDDYYCEQCRPDLHVELLKRLARRRRDRHSSHTLLMEVVQAQALAQGTTPRQ
ncbi:hypothetical protein EDB84DRAFT_1466277 [Lactarius hengduanensis]|nr:hypothetical protein EDB84DRAFT_1466277 [Lactarius hengduanensis]